MRNKETKPFFSALLDPRVQYIATSNSWQSLLYSYIDHVTSFLGIQHLSYPQSLQRKKAFLSQTHDVPPPKTQHPMLKERTKQTFNHVFSFIKHEGYIYYALRQSETEKPDWKLFYIDGLSLTRAQFNHSEMIADGENFMLRVPGEKADTIYYKKVIDEKRKGENHIITNLCEEPSAIDSWFSLPFFNWLKPAQSGKRLSLAKNAKWAMSNAAEYKYEVIDERGIKHANLPITIVYQQENGLIELHDPYVEKDSTYKVSLPYANKVNEMIEASASNLFVSTWFENKGITKPFIYSHYLDYDSEGLHPLIAVTFNHLDLNKRLLPINQTKVHELPVSLTEITNLTVVQSHHHPHSLEMRVTSKVHRDGFYFKQINDEHWCYYNMRTGQVRENIRHVKAIACKQSTTYQSDQVFSLNNHRISQTTISDFNPHCTFCPMVFKVNGKPQHIILRRYQNLVKSFIGMPSVSWSLNSSPQHPESSFLTGDQSIPVNVELRGGSLHIGSGDQNTPFSLQLSLKQNRQNSLLFSQRQHKSKRDRDSDTHHAILQTDRLCTNGIV